MPTRKASWLLVIVSVLTSMLGLSSCVPFGPVTVTLTPPEPPSSEANLRMAILSVHAWVEKLRPDAPMAMKLASVDPMPLQRSAEIIAETPVPQRELHRRRAMLRLLSFIRHTPGAFEAVATLADSPDVAKKIYEKLDRPDHGRGCQDEDPQETVNRVVNEVMGTVRYGRCEIEAMAASVVSGSKDIGVTAKLVAKGPLEPARAGVDAQRWDDCCNRLWGKAYIVKTKPNGQVEEDGSGFPVEGTPVTPYGGAYDTRVLKRPYFEQFTCDAGISCDVRLLLRRMSTELPPTATSTTLPTPPPAYVVTYNEPEKWKTFPAPKVDNGGITITAQDIPGETDKRLTVTGNKNFELEEWTSTFATYFMLRRIEMAAYLAELVCCGDNP